MDIGMDREIAAQARDTAVNSTLSGKQQKNKNIETSSQSRHRLRGGVRKADVQRDEQRV